MKTTILGAGIAGLASAVRAALRGEEVLVIEASDTYGGKIGEQRVEGFRFDTGPSLFTMPELVEELFKAAGKPCPLDYRQLNEVCNYFWQDGIKVNALNDSVALDATFSTQLGTRKGAVKRYLDRSAKTYDLTRHSFLESSLHETRTWLSRPFLKALLRIGQLPLRRTLHDYNKDKLNSPHAVQLFDRYATYNGSNPFRAPSMLSVIPHLEFNKGAYFPLHGMRSIVACIYELAQSLGVQFQFSTKVSSLSLKQGNIHEIETNKGTIETDRVVSAIDCHHFYKLAGLQSHKRFIRTLENRSTSAIVFYWGIKGKHDQLGIHNILFSNDYRKEFESLSSVNGIAKDSTIYIHISSKQNPADAPDGCENWFVMVNTGPSDQIDWDEQVQKTRDQIQLSIEKTLDIDVKSKVLVEKVMSPADIESNTQSFMGSLYGNASNTSMSAFFRHPNRTSDFRNVYFVGGSVHPGGGIPLCLLSARIADELIQKHG